MIILKELSKKDLASLTKWRNEKEIQDLLGGPFRFINLETVKKWFDNYLMNRNTQVRCSIYTSDDNKLIGLVNLLNIDSIHRTAEFSILIGETDYHNKGYGSSATRKMLIHAFNNLNLNRVYLTTLEENLKALKMYERCGFIREGLLRSAIFKNGEYKNLIVMGILREEFLSII